MNNNSKVLALKYRPQNFNDLIGQEVIAETIKNSIEANKVPNAYLFTGIRGIGKTTTARIVAKSLNCLKGIDNLCKSELCNNCEAITNSNHIDVLEMDAASKTGVDDVRDLIEFSRYGPTSSKYKIFIIDEVHMLSKQAFNALLKTLEEPPEYLKFIFATTEIKKIPITVVSRCQRFDLSRIRSSAATSVTDLTSARASALHSLATITSVGKGISVVCINCFAVGTNSGSHNELPIPCPAASKNVLAIPPPTISWSTLVANLFKTSSLLETLAPPTIASIGRSGLESDFSKASSSRDNKGPAQAKGAYSATPCVLA